MNTFHLEILSPERVFYSGDCLCVTVPLTDGCLGIMANHTPLTAEIISGEVTYTSSDGTKHICAVSSGMIKAIKNSVILLCESALHPDEIDEDTERRRAADALIEMKRKQSHRDLVLSQFTFAKAASNLRVKQHKTMN